jgi:inhibitor of cysteine peptidase
VSRAGAVLLACALAASSAACSLFASEPGPPPADITAAPGSQFTLALDANRSTGFQWELAKPLDESVVKHVGTSWEQEPNAPLGAGGKEIWTFDAVAPGWAKIELVYRRPWEEMAPARIAVWSVDVE